MKSFLVTLLIYLGASVAIFIIAYYSIGDSHLADGLASLPILFVTKIFELMEQREARLDIVGRRPVGLVDIENYTISWPLLVLYGTLAILASLLAISGVIGFLAGRFTVDVGDAIWNFEQFRDRMVLDVLLYVGVPLNFVAAYFLGKWMGLRARQRGLYAVVASIVLAGVIARSVDFLTPISFGFEAHLKSLYGFLVTLGGMLFVWTTFAVLGYWRGSRFKSARYTSYLLSLLPAESQDAIIEVTRREVQRTKPTQAAVRPDAQTDLLHA